MEIGSGKEGCYKSQQGHVGPGHKGRKESQGTFCLSKKRVKVLTWSCLFTFTTKYCLHYDYCQEEEQRLRKVALNISKDVKKFWLKIEKLASPLRIWVLIISHTCDISNLSSQNIVVPGSVQASARTR